MPRPGRRTNRTSLLALVVLAVAFLLGAADPTPRFLGLNRFPAPFPASKLEAPKLKPVVPCYQLPAVERVRSATPVVDTVLLGLPSCASSPVVIAAEAHASSTTARTDDLVALRNGSGPPLRC
ncbi:MAG: hypothetical protein ACAI25_14990 [Planctomycetota bacterium]